MKNIFKILAVALVGVTGVTARAEKAVEAQDTLTASEAFVSMGAETLDILSTSMRLDMLDYYETDSIYKVPNMMNGLSYLHRPVTKDYIKVQITPVTSLTIRVLPYKGKGKQIAASVYTISDTLQAGDSDLRFYDREMKPLPRNKFIKQVSIEDFFNFEGLDRDQKRELMALIPFPTVIYTLSPDNEEMKATLTVGEYLSKETNEKIAPYMRRERTYRWDGSKFELLK